MTEFRDETKSGSTTALGQFIDFWSVSSGLFKIFIENSCIML